MTQTKTGNPAANPLAGLRKYGQSFWLDYIRRSFVENGGFEEMIERDGLRGATSNPSIFEKAIAGSTDYAEELRSFGGAADPKRVFEQLAARDIRHAADLLRPVYESANRADGFVSLEVSPTLAHDTQGTLDEARRLWREVDRPNLMIKVPGTPEGIPAIQTLLAEGLNVNVTLLFSTRVYEKVARAYVRASEERVARGLDVESVAGVASFFVSRIDSAVDALLDEKLRAAAPPEQPAIKALLGKIAIANAKRAYQRFREIFSGLEWEALRAKGARPQRLLWASTSTKNPAYRDVLYVEELIGQDTVNTMPPDTAKAFRDHGRLRNSLEEDSAGAERALEQLESLGISLDAVTDRLLNEGVELFDAAFRKLLEEVRKAVSAPRQRDYSLHLGPDLAAALEREVSAWQSSAKAKRLWDGDAAVWTGQSEARWLDWLHIAGNQLARLDHLEKFAAEVKAEGFRHAVVLGMGGSSLAPEVLARTFGPQAGFPALSILDSTDPAQVRDVESAIDLRRTLFIVSSKSGTTLEPDLFHRYFYERVKAAGVDRPGAQFVAVTDPGSLLETAAHSDGFRRVFHGVPGIGGRYSALSDFGMVPAAAMGLDVARLLDCAETMAQACAAGVPARDNPGVVLGALLGTLGSQGRDKVTVLASPAVADFGAWLEQLLAESTGKQEKGLIPVEGEPLGPPEVYGADRLFAYLRFSSAPDSEQESGVRRLMDAGFPVIQTEIIDRYEIGREFFRWEFATAVAGSVLGINPFDQPDVEASKVATRKLTAQAEKRGSLPLERPFFKQDGIRLFADAENKKALASALEGKPSLAGYLHAHLKRLGAGDFFALLAYIERGSDYQQPLDAIRRAVRDSTHAATCLGFGPRFLHSTGQAYKGGPNEGVFLQLTCDDPDDLPVPGRGYTFGLVKAAQARGDFKVLAERGRRLLRVHLPPPVGNGLTVLAKAVADAVASLPSPARRSTA